MKKEDINPRIIKVAEFLEQNSDLKVSLAELASQFAFSKFHLQKLFKQVFGISPKQYQSSVRINLFKQTLKQKKEKDITTAIYDSGFNSSSRIYEQINCSIGMTPMAYKKGGLNEKIYFAHRLTTLGNLLMAATARGVCFVHFGENLNKLLSALRSEFPHASLIPSPEHSEHEIDSWVDALEKHLSSQHKLPCIPLHLKGTVFQIQVWKFLTSLKEGQTVSYKEVANKIGRPKSYRAVANACGANNIGILIPCHRVLKGDQTIGGYRWGANNKKTLLQIEKERHDQEQETCGSSF